MIASEPNAFASREVKGAPKRFSDCVWLLVAQTIGAFNDNATKAMLPALAAALFLSMGYESAEIVKRADLVNQQVSLMLIVPFVLFGPLAGWLSDRFSKRKVTSVALFAQVVGLAILCLGMGLELFYLSLVGFFLLAVQSAMLSPAKKGILKELVGSEKLGMAVGWMEMLTMVGILAGAYVGAKGFDALVESEGGWRAGFTVSVAVGVLAVFSWIIFRPTPEVAPRSKKPFQVSVPFSHFKDLVYLWKEKPLRLAALGDAWFWAFGSFFYLVLVKLGGEMVGGGPGMASLYGFWFLLLGVGIMAGSLVVAYLNRGRVDLGLVPLGAVLMPVILFALTRVHPLEEAFGCCCVGLGMSGAFFFVPLNAFLQDKAGEERRGRVVAASNLLTNLLVIIFIGIHACLSNVLKLDAQEEFLVMVLPSVLLAVCALALLPHSLFRVVGRIVAHIIYRVKVSGAGNLPREGGVLLVCNHVSYADPVLLGANIPREIKFLAFSGLGESRLGRLLFHLTSTIPLSPTKAKDAIVKASSRLGEGDVICIFPEGGISRVGPLMGFKKGFELIARKGGVPVVPVYLDGVWGSIFSFSGGKFFRKWPRKLPYPAHLRMGQPIPAKEAKAERVRQAIQRLSCEAFAERAEIHRPLAETVRTSLQRNAGEPFLLTGNDTKWTRGEFLRLAENLPNKSRNLESQSLGQSDEGILQLVARVLNGEVVQTGGTSWAAPELLASIFRLMETNLWNKPAFRIRLEGSLDSAWDQTWRLWAPLLGGLSARDDSDGTLTLGSSMQWDGETDRTYEGLAVSGLGVVALNLPDPPRDANPDGQKGSAEGSLGRVLSGVMFRVVATGSQEELSAGELGELEFSGIAGQWTSASLKARFDEDGFLFPEIGESAEVST